MKYAALCLSILALAATTATLSAAPAKETYDAQCAKCHGVDGKGQTAIGKKNGAKDWTDAKVQESLKDEKLTKAIKEGVKEGDSTKMKAYADLSDDDVKALVTYIRAFGKK
jgi:cytochrome c5